MTTEQQIMSILNQTNKRIAKGSKPETVRFDALVKLLTIILDRLEYIESVVEEEVKLHGK